MSDVILYAALKENERLTREYIDYKLGSSVDISFYQTPSLCIGYPYLNGALSDAASQTCPQLVRDWQRVLKPVVQSGSSGLKVCDTSGNFRCGASCTWTVPAGVTRVQFQLWGPGGGTSSNCCCGGAPFGPSGAYSVVTLDVTAGESYTLCAGCAHCCYASQTTPGLSAGNSFVTGPGLCVCAEPGYACYCHWAADIGTVCLGDGSCGIPVPVGQICTANSCAGWNFCWDSGNDNVCVEHAFSRSTWSVSCSDPSRNMTCYGINGLWPLMVIGNDNQSGTYSVSTPVFGFERCVCTETWTSSTCAGCNRRGDQGIMQIPGAGGYASQVHGGCNACGGDSGRMGMICVSWGSIT